MIPDHFLLAALILFVASLIQAMIGFAFNLIAIPLLVWSGFSLAESVAMSSIPIFVQLTLNTWQLRTHIVWRDLPLPVTVRFLSLPLGVSLLYTINTLPTATIKQFVGVVLLVVIVIQLFVRFKPRERFHIVWDILTFGISGVMLGMIGMGGPPVVVWLMAHGWEPKRTRAFVSFLFWIAAPAQIALLYWKLGDHVSHAFIWGILELPVVIIGALIGIHIGNTFDRERLKKAVILFLFLTAIVSIVSPYFT